MKPSGRTMNAAWSWWATHEALKVVVGDGRQTAKGRCSHTNPMTHLKSDCWVPSGWRLFSSHWEKANSRNGQLHQKWSKSVKWVCFCKIEWIWFSLNILCNRNVFHGTLFVPPATYGKTAFCCCCFFLIFINQKKQLSVKPSGEIKVVLNL